MLRRIRVGAHQDVDPIRHVSAGRPDLLAVDHVVISIEHGLGGKTGEVRTRTWFTVSLAPLNLPSRDLVQVSLLLIVGSVLQQGRADHVPGLASVVGGKRCPCGTEFLAQRDVFLEVETAAAVLLRPVGYDPPLVRKAVDPLLAFFASVSSSLDLGSEVLAQPGPYLFAKRLDSHWSVRPIVLLRKGGFSSG